MRVQLGHPVDIGGDRFLLLRHQRLHPCIPDQEIGCSCVFVDKQTVGPRFKRLNNRRGLAGGPTGVTAGKAAGGLSQRQGTDKGRDINAADRAPVLGPNFDQVGRTDHKLTSIAGQVVVDAAFDRPQQGRFSVIPAADDERHLPQGCPCHARSPRGAGQRKLSSLSGVLN